MSCLADDHTSLCFKCIDENDMRIISLSVSLKNIRQKIIIKQELMNKSLDTHALILFPSKSLGTRLMILRSMQHNNYDNINSVARLVLNKNKHYDICVHYY